MTSGTSICFVYKARFLKKHDHMQRLLKGISVNPGNPFEPSAADSACHPACQIFGKLETAGKARKKKKKGAMGNAILAPQLLLIICIARVQSLFPSSEWRALQALYNNTNGEHWAWTSSGGIPWTFSNRSSNPCVEKWQGVSCYSDASSVKSLVLTSHNITGRIPTLLSNLTNLQQLNLGHNHIIMPLPHSIWSMDHLILLNLEANALKGSLPVALCQASNLMGLEMNLNALSGTLPRCIVNLTSLVYLDVSTNHLTGKIPESIGELGSLEVLLLNNNSLSGTIPASIGALHRLWDVFFSNNSLTGSMPSEVGNASALMYLSAYNNSLSGSVPHSVCHLRLLRGLNWDSNAITGTIPDCLGVLSALTFFDLHNNYLTGSFPAAAFSIATLQYVDVHNNSLSGSLAVEGEAEEEAEGAHCAPLTYLDLGTNHLTGSVPPDIASAGRLQLLSLADNHLSGTLPVGLAGLVGLNVLLVQNNRLAGPCAGLFSAAQRNLSAVQLSGNQFTGPFPIVAFQLPALETFAAVGNCFSGTIPTAVCEATQLVSLALDGLSTATNCQILILPGLSAAYVPRHRNDGPIPLCLLQLPCLVTLHLSGNRLTGSLPSSLTVSSSLLDLSLSHNFLSGHIPTSLQERLWASLDLSYNKFSGELVQASFQVYPAYAALQLNNNQLSGKVPGALHSALNVSLLAGNLFACDLDHSDLPHHDPSAPNYECGSNTLDVLYSTWLVLSAAVSGIVAVVLYSWPALDRYIKVGDSIAYLLACRLKVCSLMAQSPALRTQLAPMLHVLNAADAICGVGAICTVFSVLVLMPIYVGLSLEFGTHSNQYAWVVSMCFIAGVVSFWVLMVALLLFCVVLIGAFTAAVRRCNASKRQLRAQEQDHSPGVRVTSADGEGKRGACLIRYLTSALLTCAALIVVIGANVAFVYAALYGSYTVLALAQLLLSVFKLVWINVVGPVSKRWVAKRVVSSKLDLTTMQLVVALASNIAIPCLVVISISPDCLYTAFEVAADVSSSYQYAQCSTYAQEGGCAGTALLEASTSYSPPFAYSYQCSAAFVTNYVPVFVYMCIVATFLDPLLQCVTYHLFTRATPGKWWYRLLVQMNHSAVCTLHEAPAAEQSGSPFAHGAELRSSDVSASDGAGDHSFKTGGTVGGALPIGKDDLSRSSHVFLDAVQLLVTLLTYLGLLVTFGAAYPPLAVALLLCMAATITIARLRLGHLLTLAEARGRIDFAAARLASDCAGVGSTAMLHRGLWVLVYVSCAFYALFLFDALGYAVGSRAGPVLLAVPLLAPLLHALLVLSMAWRNRADLHRMRRANRKVDQAAGLEEEGALEMVESRVNPLSVASTAP